MATISSDLYPWPHNGDLRPENTALIVIDMQIDFRGPGVHVDKMGYDLTTTRAQGANVGWTATVYEVEIAVLGAHISRLPLNQELTSRGGRFLRSGTTSARYRFHALAGGPPAPA
nr:hypothetical protein [Aliiruegeria sabulilitoris]